MAKHRNLSFRPACESKESREGGGPEVVVGETVVNVEAGAGVVGVEVVDGEAGTGVVDVEPGAKVVGVEAVDGGLGGLERSPPSPHPPSVGLILEVDAWSII